MLISQIVGRLEVEISIFRDLLAVVEREKEIILSRESHDDLIPLTEKKVGLCQDLADAQEVRRGLMRELDPEREEPMKLSDLVAFAPPAQRQAVKHAIRGLSALADRLRVMNQANKTYLEDALDTVEHILSILTGQNQKSSYGPPGARAKQLPPRLLAREV